VSVWKISSMIAFALAPLFARAIRSSAVSGFGCFSSVAQPANVSNSKQKPSVLIALC
jgi:hypothetical protein